MEGGVLQEHFYGQELLNGKGSVRRNVVLVEKPAILKKLVLFELFPLTELKPLYNRRGLQFDQSEQIRYVLCLVDVKKTITFVFHIWPNLSCFWRSELGDPLE